MVNYIGVKRVQLSSNLLREVAIANKTGRVDISASDDKSAVHVSETEMEEAKKLVLEYFFEQSDQEP